MIYNDKMCTMVANETRLPWEFKRRGKSIHVHVTGRLVFNSRDMVVAAALAGHGLAWVPDDAVGEHIAAGHLVAGHLVSVLDDWSKTFPGYHLYYASRNSSPALALVVEALREHRLCQTSLNATKATVVNPPMKDGQYDGVISQSAFETATAQFGATKAQADQLFASLETNGSGTISHNDMLSVMGATSSNPSDQTEQALLKLMDTNGDGTVSSSEFLAFEKAMVAAETPAK
jgi:LysR substrate binding domain/EF-hand domain pair